MLSSVRRILSFQFRSFGKQRWFSTIDTRNSEDWFVREATVDDLDGMVDLRRIHISTWPTDRFFIQQALQMFPGHIFVGVDRNNKICGSFQTLPFDSRFAMASILFIRPDVRSTGMAHVLSGNALDSLKGRSISGNSSHPERWIKYGSKVSPFRATMFVGRTKAPEPLESRNSSISVQDGDIGTILNYDKQVFPVGREWYIRKFIFDHPSIKIKMATERKAVTGYGHMRQLTPSCPFYIPVVFADESDVADAILASLMDGVPEDLPICCIAGSGHAHSRVFDIMNVNDYVRTVYTYSGDPVPLGWDKLYFSNYCDFAVI